MNIKLPFVKQAGFTLVEVLVASLIMLMGVTGYVTLQSEYVLADDKLNLRTKAWDLARQKYNDLSAFEQLSAKQGKICYQNIGNNLGGNIPAGEISLRLSNEQHLQAFYLTWLVTDWYYVDTNYDGEKDQWVKNGQAFYPSQLPRFASLKTAVISVAWQDTQGQSKKVALHASIAPVTIGQSAQTKYVSVSALASIQD